MLRTLFTSLTLWPAPFLAKGSLFLSPPTIAELASTGWDYKMPIA